MSTEKQTEWIISNNLVNKGWCIDNTQDKNVYFQIPKLEEQRIKLGLTKPDYILYQSKTDKPIAIIEAKKPGSDLTRAINQATKYAIALEVPLIFAMNGSYCETRFIRDKENINLNKELILNGEEVRELIREKEVLEFLKANDNEAWTIPKEVKVSREGLITTFKNLNDVLRSEGLRAGIERFSEFANILFLKLLSENTEKSWWNSIKAQSNDDIIGYINGYVIDQIKNKYGGDVFTRLLIANPRTLRHIIDAIDPLVLSAIDTDIKGDAFEYFIEKTTSTENDLGEYFTPRNIVKTIINLVDPKFKETVYDPFCGTGGFLTAAFNYIRENTIIRSQEDTDTLQHKTIYGREITTTARIAKMNMILNGDGHSGIQQINSLENPDYIDEETQEAPKFDVIVTNIPFNQTIVRKSIKDGKTITENHISPLYYNGVGKNNGDAACVLHCLRNLKEGGRMALIVPEGFLFKQHLENVRKFLLSKATLKSVISLPQGVFLPYANVKTNILYFVDAHSSHKSPHYWYFDAQNIGFTLDNHKRKIAGVNDLNIIAKSDINKVDIKADLKDNMLADGFAIIGMQEVKDNSHNLIGACYVNVARGKSEWQMIGLKDICDIIRGITFGKNDYIKNSRDGYVGIVTTKAAQDCGIDEKHLRYVPSKFVKEQKYLQDRDILISMANSFVLVGRTTLYVSSFLNKKISFGAFMAVLRVKNPHVNSTYIYYCLSSAHAKKLLQSLAKTTTSISNLSISDLEQIQIPLPPLEVQQQIVQELDTYKAIVDSAKQIIETWQPYFDIDPNWEMIKLGDVASMIRRGKTPKYGCSHVQIIKSGQVSGMYDFDFSKKYYVEQDFILDERKLEKRDILINSTGVGTAGRVNLFNLEGDFVVDSHVTIVRINQSKAMAEFVLYALCCLGFHKIEKMATGSSGQIELSKDTISNIQISLPTLEIQNEIVTKLEAERKMIEDQKKIIEVFEKKIDDKLNFIWCNNTSSEQAAKESTADK